VLAAILFPVFAKAREKARQTSCLNNERQIVTAMIMYTQDHNQVLPTGNQFWGVINLDKGALKCPTKARQVNGYVYNGLLGGKSLGDYDKPQEAVVVGDGKDGLTPANVASTTDGFDPRHGGKYMIGYLDSHVLIVSSDDLGIAGGSSSATPAARLNTAAATKSFFNAQSDQWGRGYFDGNLFDGVDGAPGAYSWPNGLYNQATGHSNMTPCFPTGAIVTFASKYCLTKYVIWPGVTVDSNPNRTVDSWNLYGSNDGTTWKLIDAEAGQSSKIGLRTPYAQNVYPVSSAAYKMFKWECTKNGLMAGQTNVDVNDPNLGTIIQEVEFFGTPG